jgi:rhamnosyltransferase
VKIGLEQPHTGVPLISAVVVTYQPTAILLDSMRRLCGQVAEVILVDNGSEGVSAQVVESAGKMPGVHLIRNGSNLGIAAALNIGIRHALPSHRPWVATFDQDTAIPKDYFEQLFQAYQMCPDSQKVRMIVPGGWTEIGASVAQAPSAKPSWSFAKGAISSGSLIRADVFGVVGFYDDALFIDYVDADFCLRLQKYGFKILSAPSIVLEHELGAKQTRRLLGFLISFRIHAAWRYYYIMRNRLLAYRRYLTFSPLWALRDARGLVLELGRIIVLENGRRLKLRATFQGIWDGLRGRTGRHPNFPPNCK